MVSELVVRHPPDERPNLPKAGPRGDSAGVKLPLFFLLAFSGFFSFPLRSAASSFLASATPPTLSLGRVHRRVRSASVGGRPGCSRPLRGEACWPLRDEACWRVCGGTPAPPTVAIDLFVAKLVCWGTPVALDLFVARLAGGFSEPPPQLQSTSAWKPAISRHVVYRSWPSSFSSCCSL